MKLIIWGMTAAIADNVVTLTPGAGEALPNHLAVESIVITTESNPAPSEWVPSAAGKRYKVTVESES